MQRQKFNSAPSFIRNLPSHRLNLRLKILMAAGITAKSQGLLLDFLAINAHAALGKAN
ncbi:hypothetical protein H6F63_01150 [Trichocoleus sp. FACHB-40]|nr:hypothetical protein [Trichocoleus sp. FACHB-40]